jgi:hypothetical protein
MIAITGCGRSGTKYISELFQKIGIDVTYEKLGKDGISSWCLVPDTQEKCFGPSYKEIEYYNIPLVHQIREPLSSISSMTTMLDISWKFIRVFIPISQKDSKLKMCMKCWYYWNLMAKQKSCYTYRIENIISEFEELICIGDFKVNADFKKIISVVPKDINTRIHEQYCWSDLKNEDDSLTNKIMILAKETGYYM